MTLPEPSENAEKGNESVNFLITIPNKPFVTLTTHQNNGKLSVTINVGISVYYTLTNGYNILETIFSRDGQAPKSTQPGQTTRTVLRYCLLPEKVPMVLASN